MDLNSLKHIFKETAWMIDPIYKKLVLVVYLGGPLSALFVLLLTYNSPDTTAFIAAVIILSLIIGFKLGPSPFLAINCTWIYFRFGKVGIWLPIVSYLMALTILGLQYAAKKILIPSNE